MRWGAGALGSLFHGPKPQTLNQGVFYVITGPIYSTPGVKNAREGFRTIGATLPSPHRTSLSPRDAVDRYRLKHNLMIIILS